MLAGIGHTKRLGAVGEESTLRDLGLGSEVATVAVGWDGAGGWRHGGRAEGLGAGGSGGSGGCPELHLTCLGCLSCKRAIKWQI